MKLAVENGSVYVRTLLHAAFWGATLVFFVLFFGREADSYLQSILFVGLLLPVAMATTYFLTAFLVPRYLLPGRYRLFALYAIYTLVVSIYLELVVLVVSFIFLAEYELGAMNSAALDIFGLIVALYTVVFLALAASLAMRWHGLRVEHDQTERARLEAELELREAELSHLKTQMQPHFLFNTLNNLYGLTLEQSDQAPEVVLRISQLLDYVLYGCDRPLVPLSGEVEHLRTYLELERLRYDDRMDIQFYVDDLPDGASVAPLLLTPFVENSFKHGAAPARGSSWVHVKLRADEGNLDFSVENGKLDVLRAQGNANGTSGIGLENVRRRLRLLYPGAHDLQIRDERDRYAVRLRFPIHFHPETQISEETT